MPSTNTTQRDLKLSPNFLLTSCFPPSMSSSNAHQSAHGSGNGLQSIKKQEGASGEDSLKQEKDERKHKPLNRVPRKYSYLNFPFFHSGLFISTYMTLLLPSPSSSVGACVCNTLTVFLSYQLIQFIPRMPAENRKCGVKGQINPLVVVVGTQDWSAYLKSLLENRLSQERRV